MSDTFEKPYSFFSAINDAHARIDYLLKICRQLVLEADPERRRELTKLVDLATKHRVDKESLDA